MNRFSRAAVMLSSAWICSSRASAILAQSNQAATRAIHVTDYAISIDLPDSGAAINGDATLTIRQSGRNDTLTLDLIKLHVQRVAVDGPETEVPRTESTNALPIAPPPPPTL